MCMLQNVTYTIEQRVLNSRNSQLLVALTGRVLLYLSFYSIIITKIAYVPCIEIESEDIQLERRERITREYIRAQFITIRSRISHLSESRFVPRFCLEIDPCGPSITSFPEKSFLCNQGCIFP